MRGRFDLEDEAACLLRHRNWLEGRLRAALDAGDEAKAAKVRREIAETEERL